MTDRILSDLRRMAQTYPTRGTQDAVIAAVDEIVRLRSDLAAARADAERYRWLRSRFRAFSANIDGQHAWCTTGDIERMRGPNLDAAIDAALAGEKRNGL